MSVNKENKIKGVDQTKRLVGMFNLIIATFYLLNQIMSKEKDSLNKKNFFNNLKNQEIRLEDLLLNV